jgi:hypothetical protein
MALGVTPSDPYSAAKDFAALKHELVKEKVPRSNNTNIS